MSHHANGPDCPLCSDKMETLDLRLLPWAKKIRAANPDLHFSWCFRDEENQNLFYDMGKSRCKWPNSKHNVMLNGKPASLAFDIFRLRSDGVADFGVAYCQQIANELSAMNAPIEWSGEWRMFTEKDHFQLSIK